MHGTMFSHDASFPCAQESVEGFLAYGLSRLWWLEGYMHLLHFKDEVLSTYDDFICIYPSLVQVHSHGNTHLKLPRLRDKQNTHKKCVFFTLYMHGDLNTMENV